MKIPFILSSRYSILPILASCAVLAACSSNTSAPSADSSTIGVSGTLSFSNATGFVASGGARPTSNGDRLEGTLALNEYTAVCTTTTAPILTGSGPVAADGTFTVSIVGGNGQPMSCYLTDSNGDNKGDFLVEDSASKDMNGNAEVSKTITPTGNVAMGAISFDAEAGEVTVPKSAVASSVSSTVVGTVFDPTGEWTIGAVDFTLPNGVRSTCTAAEQNSNSCNGPPDGMTLYLKLWQGVKTADSSAMYGLQVWDSPAGYVACGSRVGLPAATKTEIGVDFSSHGASDAEFTFPTSLTGFTDQLGGSSSVTLTDNWKMSTATLQGNRQTGCGPKDITIGSTAYSNAWVCGPDSGSKYQIGLGGGCQKTADSKPVNLTDWSGISCGSPTADANGVKTMTCTGNATISGASTAVTCTNKYAIATLSGSTYTVGDHNFNWGDLTQISSGTACSAISDAIMKLQCYAEYYYRSGLAESDSQCVPRVETDWSTSDPDQFAKKDFRPNKLVFFDQYKPFPDGTGGAILTRQERFNGVQVDSNSWVNCAVIEMGGLSIKQLSATKLLATYVSSEITTSTAKPACMAEFTGQKKTFVFYLNK